MTLTSIIHRDPQACIILDIRCTNCGPVRMAISADEPTPRQTPCPYCETNSIATPIGSGSTRRILPYFDFAPNIAELEQVQVLSINARPLARGQLVCFSEEPDIYHFAKIEEVYTNRANMSATGRPSVSFSVAAMDSGPIPHISGAETRPWWCFTDELPKAEHKATIGGIVATAAKLLKPTRQTKGRGRNWRKGLGKEHQA
jgi:hypothetical protein